MKFLVLIIILAFEATANEPQGRPDKEASEPGRIECHSKGLSTGKQQTPGLMDPILTDISFQRILDNFCSLGVVPKHLWHVWFVLGTAERVDQLSKAVSLKR